MRLARVTIPTILTVLVLLLSACVSKPTCIDPYVNVGSECCLDADHDKVCDSAKPSKELPSVEELQRQVDELLNKTPANASLPATAAQPAVPSEPSTPSSAKLTFPPHTLSLKELAGFKVVERRAVSESEIAYIYEGFSKAALLRLGYEASYFVNLSSNSSKVWQAVLRFNSSDGASDFIEDRKVLYKKTLTQEDFETMFDETYYLADGDEAVLLVRRQNMATVLLLTGLSSGQVQDVASALEIVMDADSGTSAPVDVIPDRPSYVGPGPYPYAAGTVKSSKDGVTLGIENVAFKKKGDNWGEILSITFIVDNQGASEIQPWLNVMTYDSDDKGTLPNQDIENSEVLRPGEYMRKTANLSIAIARINATKSFRVTVRDNLIEDSSPFLSYTDDRVFNK